MSYTTKNIGRRACLAKFLFSSGNQKKLHMFCWTSRDSMFSAKRFRTTVLVKDFVRTSRDNTSDLYFVYI